MSVFIHDASAEYLDKLETNAETVMKDMVFNSYPLLRQQTNRTILEWGTKLKSDKDVNESVSVNLFFKTFEVTTFFGRIIIII